MQNMRRSLDFLWKTCAAGKIFNKTKYAAGWIFESVLMPGTLSCWNSMQFTFLESQLRIFFF